MARCFIPCLRCEERQPRHHINSQALFTEVNWRFVEDWELISGLRWDYEKNHTEIVYPVDALGIATDPVADEKLSSSVLLPKIGISHDLSETQLIGLTWQRGYRSGGVNVRTRAAHDSYDPEFTSTFELAWRASWLDRRLRTSANLYHTDWKDQQVSFLNLSDNNIHDDKTIAIKIVKENHI